MTLLCYILSLIEGRITKEMTIPKFKQLKQAYGFDEVAIVPGDITVNPEQVNI
jgi:hypothetical protein